MRWPLRTQILLPFACIIIVTIVVSSVTTAVAYSLRARREVESRLADVERLLQETNFPLTDQVLAQMARLSGADFVWRQKGQDVAVSSEIRFPEGDAVATTGLLMRDAQSVTVDGRDFFQFTLLMDDSAAPQTRQGTIHIYLPQERYFDLIWDAVWPPILLGALSVIVMVAVAARIAARMSASVGTLQKGVGSLVSGDFEPIPVPRRNDEVRDLAIFANQLAQQLRQYDQEIRSQERLQTVGKLGASMAHKLGNSVTGCTLAIDLLSESATPEHRDALDVVRRELGVMKRYVDRVLAFRRQSPMEATRIDVREVVKEVCDLQESKRAHGHVKFTVELPDGPVELKGDPVILQHAVDNLVENALRAAHAAHPTARGGDVPQVDVKVIVDGDTMTVEVWDNGAGPSEEIAPHLFEAMATDQPGGTGLGLCLVKQIAREFGGSVAWQRDGERTRFSMSLPMMKENVA